ncbi:MAG: thiamine pyrophosphate-dependent enzyme, partial [Vicinamibacteria bacterium]
GAGGHNIVNALAGAYSEKVPLLVVSGGPGEEERKLGTLIHHQAKEIESQFRIFQELTCDAAIVDDPRTAPEIIDRVTRSTWLNRRPGYIEIHRDMVQKTVEVSKEILEWDGVLPEQTSDKRKVLEAARDTAESFNRAKKPALIVGIECYRYQLGREVIELAEKMGAPVFTTVLSKGAFPMSHPLYMGVHVGPLSPPAIAKRVEEADFVVSLGTLLTDINLGTQTPQVARAKSIWALNNRVNVSFHTYTEVTLRDFVRALLEVDIKTHKEKVAYHDNLHDLKDADVKGPIKVAGILTELNRHLKGRNDLLVIAESGDALFAGLELRVESGMYLAQGFYASMGFGIPATIGAQIGTGLRPIVLCGDGGFQMTGQEISHAPRYGLNPIVILLNNGGWGIFRPISDRPDVLALPNWPYTKMAEGWGGKGFRVRTLAEFRRALAEADRTETFVLIEALIGYRDLSPISLKYIKASGRRGLPGVKE